MKYNDRVDIITKKTGAFGASPSVNTIKNVPASVKHLSSEISLKIFGSVKKSAYRVHFQTNLTPFEINEIVIGGINYSVHEVKKRGHKKVVIINGE